MNHDLPVKPHSNFFNRHLLLGVILIASALLLLNWPAGWPVLGSVAIGGVALHALAALLAGGGMMVALHGRHHAGATPGVLIRWARRYDWLVALLFLGQESRAREHMLDLTGVTAGEHVLDVGCGTGTLALAAAQRVGAGGRVHGVDAAAEMVTRATDKAARHAVPVTFETAVAQSLPCADASFDVVLCTLVLHHLPADTRAGALSEIQRVLKPGGRMLIVEIGRARNKQFTINPITLLHGHKAQHMIDEVAALVRHAGFQDMEIGSLGFSVLGYILAHKPKKD